MSKNIMGGHYDWHFDIPNAEGTFLFKPLRGKLKLIRIEKGQWQKAQNPNAYYVGHRELNNFKPGRFFGPLNVPSDEKKVRSNEHTR